MVRLSGYQLVLLFLLGTSCAVSIGDAYQPGAEDGLADGVDYESAPSLGILLPAGDGQDTFARLVLSPDMLPSIASAQAAASQTVILQRRDTTSVATEAPSTLVPINHSTPAATLSGTGTTTVAAVATSPSPESTATATDTTSVSIITTDTSASSPAASSAIPAQTASSGSHLSTSALIAVIVVLSIALVALVIVIAVMMFRKRRARAHYIEVAELSAPVSVNAGVAAQSTEDRRSVYGYVPSERYSEDGNPFWHHNDERTPTSHVQHPREAAYEEGREYAPEGHGVRRLQSMRSTVSSVSRYSQ
ncbi:hypothetical protein C8Q77DRAFT_1110419 [Trametes polyzona]|nr:hypothetical protein C8Q77DRAFT_1110419 [Trametes polyzona]